MFSLSNERESQPKPRQIEVGHGADSDTTCVTNPDTSIIIASHAYMHMSMYMDMCMYACDAMMIDVSGLVTQVVSLSAPCPTSICLGLGWLSLSFESENIYCSCECLHLMQCPLPVAVRCSARTFKCVW